MFSQWCFSAHPSHPLSPSQAFQTINKNIWKHNYVWNIIGIDTSKPVLVILSLLYIWTLEEQHNNNIKSHGNFITVKKDREATFIH